MSAIRSRGRRGHTAVPNWRIGDTTLDSFEFRIAAWLASHTDNYRGDLTRNAIARQVGISGAKVSIALVRLNQIGIIELTVGEPRNRLVIAFDHDVWETDPLVATRLVTGHDTTGDWSPHDQTSDSRLSMGEEQGEEQSESPRPPQGALAVLEADFESFWSLYPRKEGKPRARIKFKSAAKRVGIVTVMTGATRWVEHWREARTDMQYVPLPATWLHNDKWDDTPPRPVAPIPMAPRERARAALNEMMSHPSNGPQHELG